MLPQVEKNNEPVSVTETAPLKPQPTNERGSFQIDSSVKIFDPNSGEVYLEVRG